MPVNVDTAVGQVQRMGQTVDNHINTMMNGSNLGVGELSKISVQIADSQGKLEMAKGSATVFTKVEKERGKELGQG